MYICFYSCITREHLEYIVSYIIGCSNYSLDSSLQKVCVHTRFLKWEDETHCFQVITLINAGGEQQMLKPDKMKKNEVAF